MSVAADAVARFRQATIDLADRRGRGDDPAHGGFPARFVIFRDGNGGTPIAVIVGKPEFAPSRWRCGCTRPA